MNNIKKFEDFLDKIQEALDNAKKQGHINVRVEDLESVLSELKESEDERIINALKEGFKYHQLFNPTFGGIPCIEIVNWLEKQGEQKPTDKVKPKFKVGDIIRFKGSETLEEEVEPHEIVSYYNELYVFADGTTDLFREQDLYELVEHKPSDKVETKFKVGDWCIDNEDGVMFKIVKVLDNTYIYETTEGKEYSCTHYSLENDAKLWTIQDAKPGDMLYCDDSNNKTIYLFKEQRGSSNIANAYFQILNMNNELRLMFNKAADFNSNTKPATKEQRDTLMKAMTDAGYTFDFEKKELKKIEENSFECDRVEKAMSNAGYEWSEETHLLKKIEQKPSWSEDDERLYQSIIDDTVQKNQLDSKQIDWLKSIKQRIGE